MAAAPRFGLKPNEAKVGLGRIHSAVSKWHGTARRLRICSSTLDAYATAFENPHMQEASRLLSAK